MDIYCGNSQSSPQMLPVSHFCKNVNLLHYYSRKLQDCRYQTEML